MATTTVASDAAPARTAVKPRRPLWAAPVFIVGIVALVVVLILRPTLGNLKFRRLDRELASLNKTLASIDGNLEEVARGAAQGLSAAEKDAPQRQGDFYLLLGSALAYRADKVSADEAAVHWRDAQANLEQAQKFGVAPANANRLAFRLAKVAAHTGAKPETTVNEIKPLEGKLEDPRDRADYYRVLVSAYLAKTPPDLVAALDANDKLRGSQAAEEVLVEARVRSAELKLQLGRGPLDIRKDLDMVPRDAPAYLRNKALVLRGTTYQQEKNWGKAAEAWQEALKDGLAITDRPRLNYLLGGCYRQLDQTSKAVQCWEECVRAGSGEEAVAASLELAELSLIGPEPDNVLVHLRRVLRDVHSPGDWHNSYISFANVKDRIERIAQNLRNAARYELAAKVAGPYSLLAPGPATVLVAESSAGWARQCREQASHQADATKRQAEELTTRDLFHRAAEAYMRAAELDPPGAEKSLWQAAACYLDGADADRQLDALSRFLAVATDPVKKAECYFLMGETLSGKGVKDKAEICYLNCIEMDQSPFTCRARLQLALQCLGNKNIDRAKDLLEDNQKRLRQERDLVTQEKTSYALGKIYFDRGDYYTASKEFEKLSSVQDDPRANAQVGPESIRARHCLARSYQEMARLEMEKATAPGEEISSETRLNFQRDSIRLRVRAGDEFTKLRRILQQQPTLTSQLTGEEVRDLPFYEADCWFESGRFNEALSLYEDLNQKHHGTELGLLSLGGMVRCYAGMGQTPQKLQRLNEIRETLKTMDPALQQRWEPWIQGATKSNDM